MCNKIPYETKKEAVNHHKFLRRDKRSVITSKQRPYLCKYCNMWHLNSAPPSNTRLYRRKIRASKKQSTLVKEFISLKTSAAKWNWLVKHQGKWMVVYIGDIDYVIFSGKTRVII